MLCKLFFISTVAWQVSAALYYVESAPVAPFSCTITHPCRLSDLPAVFTILDTIVFLPATTGTSSTYSFGSKTYLNPTVILSAGTTYSATLLTVKNSIALNCTGASFVSTSALTTTNIATVGINSCNFTASQYAATLVTVLEWTNGVVSSLSGVQRLLFSGLSVTVDGLFLKSSTTSNAPFNFRTSTTSGGAESTFVARNVNFDTVTTTGGVSAMLIQSLQGNSFGLTVNTVSFNAVVATGAMLEFQVDNTAGGLFYTEIDVLQFNVVGGSCKNGFMYANNGDESALMTANIAQSSATNVDFKGGAAFLLYAPSAGTITFNANDAFTNNICNPTNEPNLVECKGTNTNMGFLFTGVDEGSLTAKNCPPSYINGGMTCA